MPYFQIDLFFYLGRHVRLRFIHILRCPVEEIKINKHRRNAARRHRETRSAGFHTRTGDLATFAEATANEGNRPCLRREVLIATRSVE